MAACVCEKGSASPRRLVLPFMKLASFSEALQFLRGCVDHIIFKYV